MSLEAARTVTRWLDRMYLDPILGLLLPGAGDVATAATGLYLVSLAVKMKLPAVVVARMLLNLAVDLLVGAVPLAGDIFDFGFKANQRNLELLERRVEGGGKAAPGDWLRVAGAALVFVAALALPLVLLVLGLRAIAAGC